jgi:sigma-B regulation protein RsbU (phosphoserine phosphatase)
MVSTAARILVADDQPDVLEALRWLLTGEGYDAELVDSTDAVIERLGAHTFDLVLMDLNYSRDTTSGREGLALIPRIRTHDPALPIVVMTGWGSIDTAVEAMRLGAKSFVQKPWDDAALREIVGREIDEGRAARRRDHKRDREQEEARLIQRALLPTALPQLRGLELATAWQPADGVGGDCYDVLTSGPLLGIAIADVAGKGLPAALLMSNLQAAVRAFAQNAAEPAVLCGNLNRLLCRHMVSGRFVTFCFTWFDADRHTIHYANAGHNPPLLVRANGSVERLCDGGTVLGVLPEASYQQSSLAFNPGDRLLFYTDGITEARSPAGEEFGEDRLARVAAESDGLAAEALKDRILDRLKTFTGGAFDDDSTLIVVAASY